MTKAYLFFLLFAEAFILEASDRFSICLTSSSSKIAYEERFILTLILSYPKEYRPDFDALRKNITSDESLNLRPFSLVNESVEGALKNGEGLSQKVVYIMEPRIPGKYQLVFFNVPFLSREEGKKKRIKVSSNMSEVEIHFPSEIRDDFVLSEILSLNMRPSIKMDDKNREFFEKSVKNNVTRIEKKALGNVFYSLFFLIGFCLLFYLLRKKHRERSQFIVDKRDSKEKALDFLLELKKMEYPRKKMYEIFYMRLADILRNYLEEEFHVRVAGKTTEEFLEELSDQPFFKGESRELLEGILFRSDLIKFACVYPDAEECSQAESFVEGVIRAERKRERSNL